LGLHRSKAQLVQDPLAVAGGVVDAELVLDQLGDAVTGPQLGGPAVRHGAFLQQGGEALLILFVEGGIGALVAFTVRAF
jgi:hypothetical protein